MSMSFEQFGKFLEKERQRRNMTLRAASSDAGVRLTTFHRAEQGSDLNADTMLQLARWATGSNTISITLRGQKITKVTGASSTSSSSS